MSKNIKIKCKGSEFVSINELRDLQGNLKTVEKEAYERMKKSLVKYDFRFPVFFVELDNIKYILDGHGRVGSMRKMTKEGYTFGSNNTLPAVKIEASDRKEAKEILLALNSRFGKMDMDSFYEFVHEDGFEIDTKEMFEIFNPTDFNMQSYMDGYEVDIELNDIEIEEPKEKIETEVEVPKKAIIKLGDLIELGNHRLLCGDSESEEDIKKLMNNKIANHVITDPPYGIKYQSSHRKQSNKSETFEEIKNDDIILEKWMALAKKYSSGWIMYWVGWQNLTDWIDVSSKYFGSYTNIMVWRKTWGMGDITGSFKNGEMGLIYNMGAKLKDGKRPSCIFDGTMNLAGLQHSNQKPVSLFIDMLDGLPEGSILDLFGGSGSNLLACERVERACFMMELTPSNVQLIIERYIAETDNNIITLNGEEIDWLKYKESHNGK